MHYEKHQSEKIFTFVFSSRLNKMNSNIETGKTISELQPDKLASSDSGLSDLSTFRLSDFTPKQLGYYFPAEFDLHVATWLSWPHKEASWPGKIDTIFPHYAQFIKELTKGERVCINVNDETMRSFSVNCLNIC